ncbi:MAG TPA: YceI family protein [Solirubrobacteraceae bacterium]|jgi:polyisoprenoid-binding protein YceI
MATAEIQDTTAQIRDAHPITSIAGDWAVVPADSELGFETRILFGLIPVRGRYSGFAGELHVDDAGDADGSLYIEAATVSTGIKKRDAHLRSGDFFAVEEHPHLRFELQSLVPDARDGFDLSATLHIRGHELAIETPVSVSAAGPARLRVDGEFPVDHRLSGLRSTGSGWKKVPDALHVKAALTLQRTD